MLTISGPAEECDVCLAKKSWQAEFKNGFSGSLCWKCMGKMLEARAKKGGNGADRQTGSGSSVFERE